MIVQTVPMWPDRQTMVHPRDVLMLFPSNNWRWKVEEFDGVGRFPAGLTWAEFQVEVESGISIFDWDGLRQFADGLDQIIDGRIVAADENDTVLVTIDVLDSTTYEIIIDTAWSGATELASSLAQFASAPATSSPTDTTARFVRGPSVEFPGGGA